jgi:hypothetical protein
MATIRKQISIDVSPDDAWAALRDWGAVHTRLAPGFVTDTRLDGRDRIVTFFNGSVVRERLIDRDDAARRLVWSIVEGPYTHHNGSAHVLAEQDGRTTFVWITDLLPDELGPRTSEMMQLGLAAIQKTLSRRAAAPSSRS